MVTAFDLNLRHLGAIVAIGRLGSISAASAHVNLSQPALTQALAKMEQVLEDDLFDRHPSGAVPTPHGALFITRAERAIALIVEAGRLVRRGARLPPIAHLERSVSMIQLRALATVERAGSYALAARETHLSQPSVHRAVKELELIVGVPLLVRAGRTMRATAAAERMVRATRLAERELQAGLDELQAAKRAGSGQVAIGSLPLARAAFLPSALAKFSALYPHAKIRIVEGPYGELLAALRQGDIDMLIGALRDPAGTPDVVQTPLFADELSIVARAGHPLGQRADPTLTDLAEYPWVVNPPGAPIRSKWEAMFRDAGVEPPALRIECGSILVIRGLLLEGDWLALLSQDEYRLEQHAGLISPIGNPVAGSLRQIGISIRLGWRPTSTQAGMIAMLEALAAERTSGI